jgi:hypothetical protein
MEFLPWQFSATTSRLSSLRVPSEEGRKAVEPHLGWQCQLSTDSCGLQDARGREIPEALSMLDLQLCWCRRKGKMHQCSAGGIVRWINAGRPRGKRWWRRTSASWGAVWDTGQLGQSGPAGGRPDQRIAAVGRLVREPGFPLPTGVDPAVAPRGFA